MDINISNYLRINIVDMVMVLVSTFLIVLICKKFFWNFLKDYLQKREDFIQSQLDESTTKLAESEQLKAEYEAKIHSAKQEAKEIIDNATMNAKSEAEGIVSRAKSEAEAVKSKANQDIEFEKEKARKDMKQQISDVSFAIASKLMQEELTDETHKKYVEEFINEAGDDVWQA